MPRARPGTATAARSPPRSPVCVFFFCCCCFLTIPCGICDQGWATKRLGYDQGSVRFDPGCSRTHKRFCFAVPKNWRGSETVATHQLHAVQGVDGGGEHEAVGAARDCAPERRPDADHGSADEEEPPGAVLHPALGSCVAFFLGGLVWFGLVGYVAVCV